MVRLAAAALAICRMRLIDLFMREHVLLLWIIEGGCFLRVHRGICYLYHEDGAFLSYKAIPPESTFYRVKQFLLQLEGLFRLLPKDIPRKDQVLLEAINSCIQERNSFEEYLERCVDQAIFSAGSGARSRRGGGSREDGGEEEEAPQNWNILTAMSISKVGLQIQKELLEERLISYVAE